MIDIEFVISYDKGRLQRCTEYDPGSSIACPSIRYAIHNALCRDLSYHSELHGTGTWVNPLLYAEVFQSMAARKSISRASKNRTATHHLLCGGGSQETREAQNLASQSFSTW
jgi:hypothetical protein